MKTMLLAATTLGLALAMGGCDRNKTDDDATTRAVAQPENSKVNERDRTMDTLTPLDQGNSEVDRTISQQIRQGLMKDDSLSMTAKNVKIITNGGVVTLRGPVKTEQERTTIATLAEGTTNVSRVDNQLDVSNP